MLLQMIQGSFHDSVSFRWRLVSPPKRGLTKVTLFGGNEERGSGEASERE